jgi:hypothetical protein
VEAVGCGWGDGQIQRRTRLVLAAFQTEPATGARIWSRLVQTGRYQLAAAVIP